MTTRCEVCVVQLLVHMQAKSNAPKHIKTLTRERREGAILLFDTDYIRLK